MNWNQKGQADASTMHQTQNPYMKYEAYAFAVIQKFLPLFSNAQLQQETLSKALCKCELSNYCKWRQLTNPALLL